MTVIDRVILGTYNDGVTIGLRVSLPGVDALTGDSSLPGTFSFDSEWTDIAQIHAVGIATETFNGTVYRVTGSFPDLGYKPFMEVRKLESNVVRDDYWISTAPSGGYHAITSNTTFTAGFGNISPTGNAALYVVLKIPVPSG